MMSGRFLYPPARPDAGIGILFIETSGCLPMCGHGTIGIVTFALEHGLIVPAEPGRLRSEEHTSELQSLMRISYAVFCLKKKKITEIFISTTTITNHNSS